VLNAAPRIGLEKGVRNMASKSAPFPVFGYVQDSLCSLQSGVQDLFDSIRKEAGKLTNGEWRRDLNHLAAQARALPSDVPKRAGRALKSLEKSTTKLLSEAQTFAGKRLEPLVNRLSLPSKHEVELLAKRLAALEKSIEDLHKAEPEGA